MTVKNMALRALKIWLFAAMALIVVHRLRDGGWDAAASDLAWAALAALVVVASQRWHAARGAACAMCVDAREGSAREGADHV
jgi:uncharacterized membrane protein YhaH (DUF805 family)